MALAVWTISSRSLTWSPVGVAGWTSAGGSVARSLWASVSASTAFDDPSGPGRPSASPDLVPLAEHDQSLGLPAFEFGDPGGLSLQLVTEQLLFRLPLIKGPTVATAAALGCAVADDTNAR